MKLASITALGGALIGLGARAGGVVNRPWPRLKAHADPGQRQRHQEITDRYEQFPHDSTLSGYVRHVASRCKRVGGRLGHCA